MNEVSLTLFFHLRHQEVPKHQLSAPKHDEIMKCREQCYLLVKVSSPLTDSVTTLCQVKGQRNIRKTRTRMTKSLEVLPACTAGCWAMFNMLCQLSDSNLAARRDGMKPLCLLERMKGVLALQNIARLIVLF